MSTETKPGIVEMIARVLRPEAFAEPLENDSPEAVAHNRVAALVQAGEILTAISGAYGVVPLGDLEIVNGYLVQRGAHEPEYPAGAVYGALPYSDAEPLVKLSDLAGWPTTAVDDAMIARFKEAWHEAERQGVFLGKVRRGLEAALNAPSLGSGIVAPGYIALVKPDGSRKTNREIQLEAAVMRGELPGGESDGVER